MVIAFTKARLQSSCCRTLLLGPVQIFIAAAAYSLPATTAVTFLGVNILL